MNFKSNTKIYKKQIVIKNIQYFHVPIAIPELVHKSLFLGYIGDKAENEGILQTLQFNMITSVR